MRIRTYIKECWVELWNPDSRMLQYVDRILFILLPLITFLLLVIPSWRDRMVDMAWIIPFSIWFLFLLLVVPYKLTRKYHQRWKETHNKLLLITDKQGKSGYIEKLALEGMEFIKLWRAIPAVTESDRVRLQEWIVTVSKYLGAMNMPQENLHWGRKMMGINTLETSDNDIVKAYEFGIDILLELHRKLTD